MLFYGIDDCYNNYRHRLYDSFSLPDSCNRLDKSVRTNAHIVTGASSTATAVAHPARPPDIWFPTNNFITHIIYNT